MRRGRRCRARRTRSRGPARTPRSTTALRAYRNASASARAELPVVVRLRDAHRRAERRRLRRTAGTRAPPTRADTPSGSSSPFRLAHDVPRARRAARPPSNSTFCTALSMPDRRAEHARADVRHARELEQPLHRAVLAHRPVQDGEHDVDRRAAAVGARRAHARRPRRPAPPPCPPPASTSGMRPRLRRAARAGRAAGANVRPSRSRSAPPRRARGRARRSPSAPRCRRSRARPTDRRTAPRRGAALTRAPGPARRRRRGRRRPRCPTLTRTRPSAIPAARRASGAICRCVVEAACPTSVCVPPRLVATHASSSASQNALPAVDAAGDLDRQHPARSREGAAAPRPRAAGATRVPGTARARPSGCASRTVASRIAFAVVPVHAQRERHQAAQAEPRLERRHRAAGVDRDVAQARAAVLGRAHHARRSGRGARRCTSSPSAARSRSRTRAGVQR